MGQAPDAKLGDGRPIEFFYDYVSGSLVAVHVVEHRGNAESRIEIASCRDGTDVREIEETLKSWGTKIECTAFLDDGTSRIYREFHALHDTPMVRQLLKKLDTGWVRRTRDTINELLKQAYSNGYKACVMTQLSNGDVVNDAALPDNFLLGQFSREPRYKVATSEYDSLAATNAL